MPPLLEALPLPLTFTFTFTLTLTLTARRCRVRIAVATDLAARGVDLECVNLVVNLEVPVDAATYMHRVGRAGRFGTRGLAVTLVAPGQLGALTAYLDEVAGGEVSKGSAGSAAQRAQHSGGSPARAERRARAPPARLRAATGRP